MKNPTSLIRQFAELRDNPKKDMIEMLQSFEVTQRIQEWGSQVKEKAMNTWNMWDSITVSSAITGH